MRHVSPTTIPSSLPETPAAARHYRPPEGWLTYVAMIALVTIAGVSVDAADWTRIVIPIPLIAFLSAVFGSVVARVRVLDSLAHLLSLVAGFALSFLLVGAKAAQLDGSMRGRISAVARSGVDWYMGQSVDVRMEALLVSLLMGIVTWLIGYLSTWSLFRNGWLLVAVALPGFLMLVNLGYATNPDTRLLGWYACTALILIASHNLSTRERRWRRARIAREKSVGQTVLVMATVVACLATAAGWNAPSSLSQATLQPMMSDVADRALVAQQKTSDFVSQVTGNADSGSRVSGNYSDFNDQFAIGGPLRLSNQPEVLVAADYAPYLAAQHYDTYTGNGWTSTSKDTFEPETSDGRRYSPEMTFSAQQDVPLSPNVTRERQVTAFDVTPLGPSADVLLTVDTFVTASVPYSVRMSWAQLDDTAYQLTPDGVASVPVDLQQMASLLVDASLDGEDAGNGPLPSDPDQRNAIEAERAELEKRFLSVRWTASESGAVDSMFVTGQTPIYDDVESVAPRTSISTSQVYRVESSTSVASADQLRQAGSAYPAWVTDRYLSLPTTVTPRTLELSKNLIDTASNPYDAARTIETYLRQTIVYDESVSAPPDDADIVDYVLFERQRGYCEYYASAMTVMLRSVGIPARVAVGYAPGSYDQSRGGYVYLQSNAHAWVEAYFPGYGWIPFEPTASESPIDRDALAQMPTPEPVEPQASVSDEPTAEPTEAQASPAAVESVPPVRAQVTPEAGGGSTWRWAALAFLTALALAGISLWLFWTVPMRGLTESGALYARARRIGRWAGVGGGKDQTPREFADRFASRVPAADVYVHRIVETFEVDQYGPDRASQPLREQALAAWQALRRTIPTIALGRHKIGKPRMWRRR